MHLCLQGPGTRVTTIQSILVIYPTEPDVHLECNSFLISFLMAKIPDAAISRLCGVD